MNLILLRIIAALQVLGGGFGLVATLYYMVSGKPDTAGFILLPPLALAIVAGLGLWQQKRWGMWLSLVMQGLQIPVLTNAPLTHHLVIGVGVTAGFFGQMNSIGLYFQTLGYLSLHSPGVDPGAGVNLLALAFFVYLSWKLRKPEMAQTTAYAQ